MSATRRHTALATLAVLASGICAPGWAQDSLRTDHFDGWESWPLMAPGDLSLVHGSLEPVRIEFDGLFPGPQGFGVGPRDTLSMIMDLMESTFGGDSALWVQWTSRPPLMGMGAPALDLLVVDRASFRLLFRIGASRRGEWAGQYELLQMQPERLVQVTVGEDGQADTKTIEGAPDYLDFATYQFMFPLLDLREGLALRISGYDYIQKTPEVLPIRVMGQETFTDAHGDRHQVWKVDVMPGHRATLISFFVSKRPPFFYGWDYRVTRNGFMALKLTLRDWISTAMP